MLRTLLVALSLVSGVLLGNAQADSYAGLSIGGSSADRDCDEFGYNCDGSETALKVFGGFRLHENLGFEVAYLDLGRLRDESDTLTTIADTEGVNFSLHGIIPVLESSALFGKLGVMAWDTRYTRIDTSTESSSDSGTDFTFGAGFLFTWDDRYQVRFEFERLNQLGDEFVAGGSDVTLVSLGGAIHF